MNLIYAALMSASVIHGPGPDSVAVARRIAASVQVAAQEYRNGVANGRVTAQSEVEEARLFLTEARRAAQVLPAKLGGSISAEIDGLIALIARVAPADSVALAARHTAEDLASGVGAALDEMPIRTPTLARGAQLFHQECSSCHGELGRGDGPAGRGLVPVPANLTDAGELADATPLSFYHRITIGVAGTAMPAFETRLPAADRWALALYATTLRQGRAEGDVPAKLRTFATVAVLTDSQVLVALGSAGTRVQAAAVRGFQPIDQEGAASAAVFTAVRDKITAAVELAAHGQHEQAASTAFDAYLEFEKVESTVHAKDSELSSRLEAAFATLRTRAAGGATTSELAGVQRDLGALLEQAERVVSDRMSAVNLFVQSLVIMLREGLEAILIIGALIAFLMKAGAGHRKRDIHIGVGAAIAMSLLTAVLLETVFAISAAHRGALEGLTMMVAVVVLFYVSYWLLSKMEVAKWTAFVKERLAVAVDGGSAFALASAAFLAVYREGFETVLFYKALFVEGGALSATFVPVTAGIVAGGLALAVVYIAINRWGVRLPLKPFFALTSGFLYYMAFVFAGKGVAELQEGGLLGVTYMPGWPRFPALGIYPTLESNVAQSIMALLAGGALLWIFVVQRVRDRQLAPVPVETARRDPIFDPAAGAPVEETMLRSLERMEADLGALRAEVERMRQTVVDVSADEIVKGPRT